MCGGKFLVLGCHCTSNLNNFEIWHVEGNKMFSIGEKMCSLGEEVLGGTWNFPPRKRLCSLGLGDIIFENTTFPQGRVLPRETYPRVNPMVQFLSKICCTLGNDVVREWMLQPKKTKKERLYFPNYIFHYGEGKGAHNVFKLAHNYLVNIRILF